MKTQILETKTSSEVTVTLQKYTHVLERRILMVNDIALDIRTSTKPATYATGV